MTRTYTKGSSHKDPKKADYSRKTASISKESIKDSVSSTLSNESHSTSSDESYSDSINNMFKCTPDKRKAFKAHRELDRKEAAEEAKASPPKGKGRQLRLDSKEPRKPIATKESIDSGSSLEIGGIHKRNDSFLIYYPNEAELEAVSMENL